MSEPGEPASVLVVDDDEATRETIGDVLRLRGHAVRAATSGEEALAAVAASPVHAVIVDLRLPDVSGFDLLESVKRVSPDTEVIVVTGHASLPSALQALDSAAFAYLAKPFEMDDLVRALDRALERRRLTAALRRSEERYRLVTESIMDAVFLLDPAGRVLLSNPRATALTGRAGEALRGRAFATLLTPDGAREVRLRTRAAASPADRAPFFETRLCRADGTAVWVETSITSVRKGDGIVGWVAVARDIGGRKAAEEALRESHETQRALIEASPLAIIAVSPAGSVTMWNGAAERIFGWVAGEVIDHPLPIVPADREAEFLASQAEVLSGRVVSGVETRRVRKDGSLIDVSMSLAALRDATGAVVGIMSILADITERRGLEDQLRQAQKLEAIGSLAGGIAHDFNNLLTVIGGRSHIMGWRIGPDDPLRRDIEIIEQTAERAAGLTRQLLAFSRKQALQPRVLDLNEVVTGMDRMLQRLIGEDIDLVTVPGPHLGRVRADVSQIEQVILNLAVNARDAMPGGGRLTIETLNVELDLAYTRAHAGIEPGEYVLLAVSDTGHGMDARVLEQLFVPFFTTKEPGKGTGLGLATVYGIVKQSGGHIWAYSEVGQGTTFKIYLPRVVAAPDAVLVRGPVGPPPRGKETILLVEDDEMVRTLAAETLESAGYTVLQAPNPDEALRAVDAPGVAVALVVTDVVMPQGSGRALADRLIAARPATRVLFISGYTASAIVHHGVLDPGMAFLHKPFTPSALARKVREVLDQPA